MKKLKLDLAEKLPNHLRISELGTHFYRFGISIVKIDNCHRSRINHPLFVHLLSLSVIAKSLISLSLDSEKTSDTTFFIIGDWVHFLGARIHGNILLILNCSSVILSQIFHFQQYFNQRQSKEYNCYLAPIIMMSGQVSPLTIGLIEAKSVQLLLTLTRYLLVSSRLLSRSFALSGVIFNSVLIFHQPNYYMLPVTIFHMGHLCLGGYFLGTFFTYQISYFFIIITYFILRIRHLHYLIESRLQKSGINGAFIRRIINENNWIQKSIEVYNRVESSKFLFIVIFINGSFINFIFYIYFFVELNALMKNMCFYFTIIWSTLFIAILHYCSLIVLFQNKTYSLLTKIIYSKNMNVLPSLKVTFKTNSIKLVR